MIVEIWQEEEEASGSVESFLAEVGSGSLNDCVRRWVNRREPTPGTRQIGRHGHVEGVNRIRVRGGDSLVQGVPITAAPSYSRRYDGEITWRRTSGSFAREARDARDARERW